MSWTAGGGAGSPEHGPAAVSSPGKANPALRGLIRAGVWPWSTVVACVVHWRARTGGAGLGTGSSTARAARWPRSSPERGAWAPRARQGLRDLAQWSREDLGCLPRACNGRMRRAGVPMTLTGGGGGWISRSRCWGGPPGSWAPRSNTGGSYEVRAGVSAGCTAPAARNRGGAEVSPSNGPGEIQARQGLGSGAKSLGRSLGPRRSYCDGWHGLKGSGAVGLRRRGAWGQQWRGGGGSGR